MPDTLQARWRAYICCGPRCTEQRSPALLDVLQREIDRAGLGTEVEVLPGGCQKHCERGPSLVIWPGPVYYERIDLGRLRRIVHDHLAGGCPVRDLFYRDPGAPRPPATRPTSDVPTPARSAAPIPQRPTRPVRPTRPSRDVDDFSW